MEDERAANNDVRVPIIAAIFCLCVIAGGVFLSLYVFVPALSQPWFPVIALVLIGSPWLFWLFTYLYTCMKGCIGPGRGGGGGGPTAHVPQRQATMNASSSSAATITHNGGANHQQSPSVASSSRESEFPLAYAV